MRFDILKRGTLWITLGVLWMIACAVLFSTNLRLSKQFTWGIEYKLTTSKTVEQVKEDISTALKWENKLDISANQANGHINVLIQPQEQDDNKLSEMSTKIQDHYKSNASDKLTEYAIIWPSIWNTIKNQAIWSIVAGLLIMAVFIIFAFKEIRRFVQPWILALITIFTMLFDILSPMGIYGIKMVVDQTAQVDVIFIIAILTTMAYSINDTIVIFDRVRENLSKNKNANIKDIFEDSLWQTMGRSLTTAFAVFLVVFCMYLFGTGDLKSFAFTMLVWVITWSYSSIFMAWPIAYLLTKNKIKTNWVK